MLVPAHVEDGHAEGPLAAALGVALLDVTQPGHELLAGDALAIRVFVSLSDQPQLIGQQVSIGGQSSHAANLKYNLYKIYLAPFLFYYHVLIQFVNLLRVEHLVQQLVGVPPLSGQDDAIIRQNSWKYQGCFQR